MFVLLFGSLGFSTGQGQITGQGELIEAAPSQAAKKAIDSEPKSAKSPAKTAATVEMPRLAALQKLQFDRRPSAVLKLMSIKVGADDPPGSDKLPLSEKLSLFVQTALQAESPIPGATLAAIMG